MGVCVRCPPPTHAHNPSGAHAWSAAAACDTLLSLTAAPAVMGGGVEGGKEGGREGAFTDLAAKIQNPELQHLYMWTPTGTAPSQASGLCSRLPLASL